MHMYIRIRIQQKYTHNHVCARVIITSYSQHQHVIHACCRPQEVLQKRLAKAKLATESAHESERRALTTLEVERADLEAQRDAVKQELWAAQAEVASLRADLENEQKKAKKLKTKVRKTGEVRGASLSLSLSLSLSTSIISMYLFI